MAIIFGVFPLSCILTIGLICFYRILILPKIINKGLKLKIEKLNPIIYISIFVASFLLSFYEIASTLSGESTLQKLTYQYEKTYLYKRDFEKQKDFEYFSSQGINLNLLDKEIERALIDYEFEYGLTYRDKAMKALREIALSYNIDFHTNDYMFKKENGSYIILLNIKHGVNTSRELKRRYDIKETNSEKKEEHLDEEKREELVNKISKKLITYENLNGIVDESDVRIALSSIAEQYKLIFETIEITKNNDMIEISIEIGHEKYVTETRYTFYVKDVRY